MSKTGSPPTRRRWWSVVADLGCVLALAVGGRGAHAAGESVAVVLVIAWPFAVAVGVVHLWLGWRGRRTTRVWPEGVAVVATTFLLGMLLRAAVGRGLAPGFLVVAGVFLTLTMLGWRGAVWLVGRSCAAETRSRL